MGRLRWDWEGAEAGGNIIFGTNVLSRKTLLISENKFLLFHH